MFTSVIEPANSRHRKVDVNHLIEKLRKRLQVFRPELVHLKGVVEQNSAREGTHSLVQLAFALRPDGGAEICRNCSIGGEGSLRRPATADQQTQRSVAQHKWQRRRVADFNPKSQAAFEDTIAAVRVPTASSDDIRST